MGAVVAADRRSSDDLTSCRQVEPLAASTAQQSGAFAELERGVHAALETYSNVHRGTGHNSIVSTRLYEQAREIVLEHLGLDKSGYQVVFCSPRRAELLEARLALGSYRTVSSHDIGLPLGVRAVAVSRAALPKGVPFETGGGTARLVSPGSVIWAKPPDSLEAGTPAIVNVIAFARALQLTRRFGAEAFRSPANQVSPDEAGQAAAEILRRDDLEQYSGRELLESLKPALVGRNKLVPTVAGDRPFINLDNAASTPTFTPIWNAVCQAWRAPAAVQRELINLSRSICAEMLAAPLAAYDVIFTSNTTEAINLVAESLGRRSEPGIQPVVLNTFLEHNSNELPWRVLPGVGLLRLGIDDEGFVDLAELETLLAAYNRDGRHAGERIVLVAVSGASNVLGTFNDLAEIGRIAHRYGARFLVDAAQMVAHRKVDIMGWGIDYLAFSAHKAYAPFGTGALVARKGLLGFDGDALERLTSSGEENVAGIAALGKALLLLQRIGLDVIQAEEQALTARALRGLAQVPGIKIYGVKDVDSPRFARKGGVIPFDLGKIMPARVAKELAERGGIGARSGCHCAHLLLKRVLHIPRAIQQLQGAFLTVFPQLALPGVVRVSLGLENGEEDVDALVHVLGEIAGGSRGGAKSEAGREIQDFTAAAAQRVYGQPG